jgi:hypothetical protein
MVTITRDDFLNDRQGRTFADVCEDAEQPFDELLAFFADEARQRRMEEAETHHDRPALAGVVRELESQPAINDFLATAEPRYAKRFRQSVGVLVRMIMEARGWRKTGRKGSLGVRTKAEPKPKIKSKSPAAGRSHNTGGLAFWFLRAERYQPETGLPYLTVKERCTAWESSAKSPAKS